MYPKLVLETGEVLEGKPFGAIGECWGELVFNTCISGYEEIITDPSYKGQIVVMTNPHINNYGINYEDIESGTICVEGFVVYENTKLYSNYRAKDELDNFLKKSNIVGISGIDTRYLTKIIRSVGSLRAMITYRESSKEQYLNILKSKPRIEEQDLVVQVSTKKPYIYHTSKEKLPCNSSVCVLDYGVKRSILEELKKRGFSVEVLPFNITVKELLTKNSFFYLFSNGPGDPKKVVDIAQKQIKALIEENRNLFCICLGHQLVALSMGIPAYKLLFGHHGGNHPVKDLEHNKIFITSQNHNFAVKEKEAQDNGFVIKYKNLYDGTLEGMYHKEHHIFSVQFHPEAGPGPTDTKFIFDEAINFFLQKK